MSGALRRQDGEHVGRERDRDRDSAARTPDPATAPLDAFTIGTDAPVVADGRPDFDSVAGTYAIRPAEAAS